MANRRPQPGGNGGRRMDFNRNDGRKNFGRSGVSPWQGGGPGAGLPNLLPLGGGSTEATLALASNIINLLQPRPNPVPSLLDMPIRRDFGPQMGRFDRGFVPNRMGNQGNFRRTGNYNRAGERINTNRKQFKPNDGPKQQPKSSPKKEADSKAKPVKESENQEEKKEDTTDQVEIKQEDGGKKESPKTRYDEINPQLLKCHICNKSMWDGRSFENHLSGRAHAIMMQKTAQSYALTADTMRQEFKIREMKRHRRTGSQPARDFYCAMCDMYAADGALHRTTVGHRKLKKYLHPTCTSCHKEMPTRIELDEHRLTAEHLKNMQDKQEVVTKPKPEVMVISTLTMEQSYLRDDRQRKRRHDTHDGKDDKDPEDNQDGIKTESGNEEDKNTDKKAPLDTEDTILDYKEGDDLSHITSEMLPMYSTTRGVGASFLSEFRCVQCRLCHKLLDSEQTARVHLRTWKHHQLFVKTLVPQTQPAQESAPKRSHAEDDEGNWKRQKTSQEEDQDGFENGDISMKEEPQDGAAPGNDVEDPSNEELDQLEDWGDDTNADDTLEETEDQNNKDQPSQGKAEPSEEADYLDNWADESMVDEILRDEQDNQEPEVEPEPEQEPEPEPEPVPEPVEEAQPEPVKEPVPVTPAKTMNYDNKPRGSPRGRGRGRARGRGRY